MRVAVTFRRQDKVRTYADAVRQAGLEPLLVSPGDTTGILEGIGGLVLTGGSDLNPELYAQPPHPRAGVPDTERDLMERRLLEGAFAADLPVLAICRGLQLLNVVRGGTLFQHIEGHNCRGVVEAHAIEIVPGTELARILAVPGCTVNSRHHQAADRIGEGLVVAARAPDGAIEALEDPSRRFLLAVQWHPEDRVRTHAMDRGLFEAFARAVEP